LLTRKSKAWLAEGGYPPGPLLTADPAGAISGWRFKSAKLAALRREFPATAIGIGDKLSDAQSYVDNGLTAYLIPHCDRKDPRKLRVLAAEIRALRGQGRLQVVDGWKQIEDGIFHAAQFPPEKYADQLELQAAKLEAERERK